MTRRLTYVVGVPGAGKSTMFREMRKAFVLSHGGTLAPFATTIYGAVAGKPMMVELGRVDHPNFPGTDTLSFNVSPRVSAWLARPDLPEWCDRVVGEGDRLSSAKFFDAVSAAVDLRVVLLDTPLEVAEERRAQRGSRQDPGWLKGRFTKVANLTERGYVTHKIDGTLAPRDSAAALLDIAVA